MSEHSDPRESNTDDEIIIPPKNKITDEEYFPWIHDMTFYLCDLFFSEAKEMRKTIHEKGRYITREEMGEMERTAKRWHDSVK